MPTASPAAPSAHRSGPEKTRVSVPGLLSFFFPRRDWLAPPQIRVSRAPNVYLSSNSQSVYHQIALNRIHIRNLRQMSPLHKTVFFEEPDARFVVPENVRQQSLYLQRRTACKKFFGQRCADAFARMIRRNIYRT